MSGARGTVRKVYDKAPAAVTSNGTFDGSAAPTTVWSSGLTGPALASQLWLSDLSESLNDNGRVGISIACETLDLRIRISPQISVTGFAHLRMLVIADNECDGAAPGLVDILGDASGSATTIATGIEMSFLQPAYFGRFHVIEDKNWYWSALSTGAYWTMDEMKSFYHEAHHDLKGHRIMWDTTDSSAIANARKGHIFVFFLYSNTVTGTGGLPTVTSANPPTIHIASRLRYRDA